MFGRRIQSSCSYKPSSSPSSTNVRQIISRRRVPQRCLYFTATTQAQAIKITRFRFSFFHRLSSFSSSTPLNPLLPVPAVAQHSRMISKRAFTSSSVLREKDKQKLNEQTNANVSVTPVSSSDDEHHDHGHTHSPSSHSHSHSHSVFSGHTHSRDDGPTQDVEGILQALRGKGDRGSRITLLGLVMNVGLTGAKGAAGWYMNSAALLAEAGHSASDLLGDLVTLFAWRFSRRQPTLKYPYGFGKFETLGTTTVALILVAGALGIGAHSLTLLTHHLVETAATLPPGPAQTLIANVTEVAQSVVTAVPLGHGHSHGIGHGHGDEALALDPNAAWFALASVIIKEWLYRVTKRVASLENSGVLLANAVHHRADAYTSFVALVAILSSSAFPAVPLDPIGGVLVACVILKQGLGLFLGSFGELTDAGVKPRTRLALENALLPLIVSPSTTTTTTSSGNPESSFLTATPTPLKGIQDLRAQRAGALLFVDLKARVPPHLTVAETARLEERITDALRGVRKEIAEVRVKFVPVGDGDEEKEREGGDGDADHSRYEDGHEDDEHVHGHVHSHHYGEESTSSSRPNGRAR